MKPYLPLFFSSLLLLSCVAIQGQQANNRITGNYKNCVTWQNQNQVGAIPAQIISGTTVTLTDNHSTYQSITLADATSAIDLVGNNYLDVTSKQGSMNMEYCPTLFRSQDNSYCISLWGSDNLNWPYSEAGSNKPTDVSLTLVIIKLPGYYRLDRIFTSVAATIANGGDYKNGCWGNQFYIEANIMKNGSRMGGPYVIQNRSNDMIATTPYPNCITSSPPTLNLESQEYNFLYRESKDVDFGYCNPGDVISMNFHTERDRIAGGRCDNAPLGMMQGYVKFAITIK